MSSPRIDPAALAAAFRDERRAFEVGREGRDQAVEALLRRYVAALFREHEGLHALAVAVLIDEEYRIATRTYVGHELEGAWARSRVPCAPVPPHNDLAPDVAEQIRAGLARFLPALDRLHGENLGLLTFRRDSAAPDGVASAQHPVDG